MGKIISNGIEYGGSSINNEINGVFIDTDNVIDSGSYNPSNPLNYTAAEDCVALITLISQSNHCYVYVDSINIYHLYTDNTTSMNLFVPLKKGQVLTASTAFSAESSGYAVYGIQQGSQDTAKNEIYSTEERAVGTWIDGSTIYQKTVNIGKITSTGEKVYTLGIENVDYLVDVRITPLLRASEANLYTLDNYNPSWSTGSYTSVAMNNDPADGLKITIYSGYYTSANDIYVTVQYTKSTI